MDVLACTHPDRVLDAWRPAYAMPQAPDAPLPTQTRVGGHFRTLRVAHRTGRCTVYLAADRGALVALKEFSAAGMTPDERAEALAWLAREAGLLATLAHPQLPTLLAAFSEGDRHYLAMPFLEGETLEEVVRRTGPQHELAVLQWGVQLADLLAYLHRQDPPIVHRDVKPANILRCPDGTLMLLDFGIATRVRRGELGTAIGTPGYAPPEQYQGLADERSDLYALGVTLHRLLTGYDPEQAPPFRHPPVRALNPAVCVATAAVVDRLLAPAPSARLPSARAVAAALAAARHHYLLEANRPAHRLYRQALGLLAGSVPLGGALDIALLALGLAGPARLPLILLPSLLCLLASTRAGRRQAPRQRRALAAQRRRLRITLALGWCVLLVSALLTMHGLVELSALGVSGCLAALLAYWGYGGQLQHLLAQRGWASRQLLAPRRRAVRRLAGVGGSSPALGK